MIAGLRSEAGSPLARAGRAAAAAGVTRLAELTGLDCVGMPVWQAVRPASRALSVHQGKGLDDDSARIGALLEAVESHFAETFEAAGPPRAWADLNPLERPDDLADFAHCRNRPPEPDLPVRWAAADLWSGDQLVVPFPCVSLDFTRDIPSVWDRSSNGVATGASLSDARLRSLCELVERDAVTEWRARAMLARMDDQIDQDTIPFDWFGSIRDAVRAAGIWLTCYRVPALSDTPVMVCETADYTKTSACYQIVWGSGCDPCAETALRRAVTEALQSRVTLIAGAREDVLPSVYAQSEGAAYGFGLPLPPGRRGVAWDAIAAGPDSLPGLVEGLGHCGFEQVAWVELGQSHGFVSIRAFAPGLAGIHRRRRNA